MSGFARLLRLHVANNVGDALVAVALAGTLFFDVPIGQARQKVALYLLTTVAPFTLVAPVVGPLLDRARRGRRVALAGVMAARIGLAYAMSRSLDPLTLYPSAFGILVLSRAYGVGRSAAIPRVVPPGLSLVGANARTTLTGIVLATVAAPVAYAVSHLAGPGWVLRAAMVVFGWGVWQALRLPVSVDHKESAVGRRDTGRLRKLGRQGERVRAAVLGAASLRALVGFLTMFLAFLLRSTGLGAHSAASGTATLAGLAAAASLGSVGGTVLGNRLRRRTPEVLVVGAVAGAAVGCLVGARLYSLVAAYTVATVASLAGSLAKLAVDAVIQRDTPAEVTAQAFSRSETVLQLAWVGGGFVGILLPLRGGLGLLVAGLSAAVAAVGTWQGVRRAEDAVERHARRDADDRATHPG